MIARYFFFILITLVIVIISCKKDKDMYEMLGYNTKYLHLSHIRTYDGSDLDPVVTSIDYKQFDMLWLGGDLSVETTKNETVMQHLDNVFSLGQPNTLWALGNHDYPDLVNLENYTNRPAYYAYAKNDITFVVLDTQENQCNITGNQKNFLFEVLDTINESSHLIILHHKLFWMPGNTYLESKIPTVSNGKLGDCAYCLSPNNFYMDIYPKLIEIQNNGTEVLCVGGDIGSKVKKFDFLTPEGIQFLASGIKSGDENNLALLFRHNREEKKLIWEFLPIVEL